MPGRRDGREKSSRMPGPERRVGPFAPALGAHDGDKPVVAVLEPDQLAELARGDGVTHGQEVSVPATVLVDGQRPAAGDEVLRGAGIDGQRLVDDDRPSRGRAPRWRAARGRRWSSRRRARRCRPTARRPTQRPRRPGGRRAPWPGARGRAVEIRATRRPGVAAITGPWNTWPARPNPARPTRSSSLMAPSLRGGAMAPETWTNWAGDQHCAPAQIARPSSEAELAEVVAQAADEGLRVRAAGSAHSFTDIACTDGRAGADARHAARDRRRSGVRAGPRAGRDHAAPARAAARRRGAWRSRTRATSTRRRSPARWRRRPTAPACGSATCRRASPRCGS